MFDFFHIRCDFLWQFDLFWIENGFELINRYFAQICACIFTRTYLSNYVNHINVINWTICKLWSRIDLNTIRIFSFTQGTVGDYWFGAKQSPRNCANSRTYQCTQFPRKKSTNKDRILVKPVSKNKCKQLLRHTCYGVYARPDGK